MEKKEGIKHHVNYMFVYYYNYITCDQALFQFRVIHTVQLTKREIDYF